MKTATTQVTCPYCEGSGYDPASVKLNARMERSYTARGGNFSDDHCDYDSFCEACPECDGDGETDTNPSHALSLLAGRTLDANFADQISRMSPIISVKEANRIRSKLTRDIKSVVRDLALQVDLKKLGGGSQAAENVMNIALDIIFKRISGQSANTRMLGQHMRTISVFSRTNTGGNINPIGIILYAASLDVA